MRRFEALEMRRFFASIDSFLDRPAKIIVIGGSAIALHGVDLGTTDIDTFQTDLAPLRNAIALAVKATNLEIPVNHAGVADLPINFEDRLELERGSWTRLVVFKLERHDLALSKTVRGNDHDIVAIERLHDITTLDLETLVARYIDEMGHAIGDQSRLDANFVEMIYRVYGEIAAERAEERVRIHRRRPKG